MGIDVFDPLVAGMGCGFYLCGVDVVSCISPLNQKMYLEIMSGSSDGQGSIRLSELSDDDLGGITFLLHSALIGIDQISVVLFDGSSDAKTRSYFYSLPMMLEPSEWLLCPLPRSEHLQQLESFRS